MTVKKTFIAYVKKFVEISLFKYSLTIAVPVKHILLRESGRHFESKRLC